MMRPFILFQLCQKFSIPLNSSAKKAFLPLLLLVLSHSVAHAEIVQRWQDNHGQWHFGDQAAAIGRKTKPVIIKNPISVVQNDQAQSTKNKTTTLTASLKANKKSKKYAKTGNNQLNSAKNQHKQQCTTLRDQVYGQPVTGKTSQVRQNLVRQYEQNCIAGNYYGD